MKTSAELEALIESTPFGGDNAAFLETMFDQYHSNSEDLPEHWRGWFDGMANGGSDLTNASHLKIVERLKQAQRLPRGSIASSSSSNDEILERERQEARVIELIGSYRQLGHARANLDPLGQEEHRQHADALSLENHGLGTRDLDQRFYTGTTYFGFPEDTATLREIVGALEATYSGTVATETMHVIDPVEREWIQKRIESVRSHPTPSIEDQKTLLDSLTAAEGLEQHLDAKYPGVKRFSLQGGESLIPMLDTIIQEAGSAGTKEIVMGMAHRGRLNVLVNIFGKNPTELFEEFEGKRILNKTGDVKYHMGFSSNVHTKGGEVHLAMAFNPSHLEIVSPVVVGSVSARQERRGDSSGEQVLPLIMHGDAAFAGQGVVMETLQMSQTRGFGVGGTIHLVINNQVGFTTSREDDARSTEYCTEVAKMVQAPVIHVNADDPEAVLFVSRLAVEYRNEFHKDIVIDLVCYRRRGHNEADDPSITQPMMYSIIKKHPTTLNLYQEKLVSRGTVTSKECDERMNEFRTALDKGNVVARALVEEPNAGLFVDWNPYLNHDWDIPAETGCDLEYLQEIGGRIVESPEDFSFNRQVKKLYEERKEMAEGATPVNWGMAELLAYATLADQGFRIRLSGQDSGRGTFSHRHAILHDSKTGESYSPLENISSGQREVDIYDSLLSEEGVLGFEYGYASTTPNSLVMWEAQFGDFMNGAQVVIDQFISSGEHKWQRLCGLTLLLPHGYEGQGAEHSSARIERFLQLCAGHNIQVCVPTTSAQIFHLLRRQAIRPMRRPLIVMTPKSLLRSKLAVCSLEDLANGAFLNVIPDLDVDPAKVRKIVLCSGKVYYHLVEQREQQGKSDVAIIRIEQLYPFPEAELREALAPFTKAKRIVWCQEEPVNQGAWYSTRHRFTQAVNEFNESLDLEFAGREASSAPAVGYMSLHLEEQDKLVMEALS